MNPIRLRAPLLHASVQRILVHDVGSGVSPEGSTMAKIEVTHGVTRGLAVAIVAILKQQEQIMADLSGIQGAVESLTSVVDSAGELLTQLAETIRTTEPNQQALDDLADSIDAQRTELAEAVAAAGGGGPTAQPLR
jgi:ABC-type transporter Mla subunit MlaD